jgi:hypothetical protein
MPRPTPLALRRSRSALAARVIEDRSPIMDCHAWPAMGFAIVPAARNRNPPRFS